VISPIAFKESKMATAYTVEPIHNMGSAAERCHVSREVLGEWIVRRG
jgi:hypothetical protein